MHKTVAAGDHLIPIGEVKAFDHSVVPGLGNSRGAYVTPAAEAEALSKRADLVISALIEQNGKVLLLEDGQGQLALPNTHDVSVGASEALARLIAEIGLHAEAGFIYSVYSDAANQHQHISFHCQAAAGRPKQGAFTVLSDATLRRSNQKIPAGHWHGDRAVLAPDPLGGESGDDRHPHRRAAGTGHCPGRIQL